MRQKLNKNIILWGISVLQPASASDVISFIAAIYPEVNPLPKVHEIRHILEEWKTDGYLIRVHGKSKLYSITYKANKKLTVRLRRNRDKARLFLLKTIRNANKDTSGDRERDSVGVSPTIDGSRFLQEGARPINTADAPRGPRIIGRVYWPRISKQLNFKVGPNFSSPDTFFEYYSFPTLKSVYQSSNRPARGHDLSITDLSLVIGVSPRLLTSFIHAPQNHYRKYEIGKRGGGKRTINSPRTFLKVVQYFILDYFLFRLQSHEICHSFQKSKSILTNSLPHINKNYVANIDIKDFFPSITQEMVISLLKRNEFGEQLSKTISRIVTLHNALPQGAPTSPIISNAILYNIDRDLMEFALPLGLSVTRYADDITISGDNKENIIKAIVFIEEALRRLGLLINDKKTRIASKGGQQKVTGIVVNEVAQPPRKFRKQIRAMFHNADNIPQNYVAQLASLRGYVSYLQSFPHLKGSEQINKYLMICKKINKINVQQQL